MGSGHGFRAKVGGMDSGHGIGAWNQGRGSELGSRKQGMGWEHMIMSWYRGMEPGHGF